MHTLRMERRLLAIFLQFFAALLNNKPITIDVQHPALSGSTGATKYDKNGRASV